LSVASFFQPVDERRLSSSQHVIPLVGRTVIKVCTNNLLGTKEQLSQVHLEWAVKQVYVCVCVYEGFTDNRNICWHFSLLNWEQGTVT